MVSTPTTRSPEAAPGWCSAIRSPARAHVGRRRSRRCQGSYKVLAYDTRGHGEIERAARRLHAGDAGRRPEGAARRAGRRRVRTTRPLDGRHDRPDLRAEVPGRVQDADARRHHEPLSGRGRPIWQERIKTADEKAWRRWSSRRWRAGSPSRSASRARRRSIGIAQVIASTPVAGYVGCCHAIPKINLTDAAEGDQDPDRWCIVRRQDRGTPPAMSHEIQQAKRRARSCT